ncbi:hypothetical protein [Pseudoduganella namucuonensis]|uniref:Uncharacterized protein n=1 Tax=Pseudoduganella namucuonensis TaxID=1035707 RepID=A0A1I7LMU2_9BURK|nr:hypothetical protein [Pseudoduganella namucuonensis]SFV11027.1 hypothetical protein SAMN05216552_103312 [Pseudoduganella namucuonensis]
MRTIIDQAAQRDCAEPEARRRRERQSAAFQAAIDYYRLDVDGGRPPPPPNAGEADPPVTRASR